MASRTIWRQQTALITGASSGIGLEVAREFATGGFDVILVARNREVLEQLAVELRALGVTADVIAADLSRKEAPAEVFSAVESLGRNVDVLVNNAGIGTYGPFAQSKVDDELAEIAVNVTALTELTHRFVQPMLGRHSGRILNVASTAAFQPGPLMAVYYATKAYVLSFSQAIANELHRTGVTVTVLCPGTTATNFQHRAGVEQSRLFKRLGAMNARVVARAGYRGTMRGRRMVIPGWQNKLLAQAVRIAPRRLVTAIARKLQEPV